MQILNPIMVPFLYKKPEKVNTCESLQKFKFIFYCLQWKHGNLIAFFFKVDLQDSNPITFRPRCNGNCECLLIFQAMTELLCNSNSIVSNEKIAFTWI